MEQISITPTTKFRASSVEMVMVDDDDGDGVVDVCH